MSDVSQMPHSSNVVIAGGAAIGSSVAYHLASNPDFSGTIVVVEKDPTYQFSASALSAASIRQQFSSAVNIRISMFGLEFIKSIGERLAVGDDRPDLHFTEYGYLYLGTEAGRTILQENQALQTAEGADIVFLEPDALQKQFPYFNPDEIAAACWGRSGEGWFDGWGLMQAFRKKARSLGVVYVQGTVTGVERSGGKVDAVILDDGTRIACGALVNASGASGGRQLAAAAAIDIPVHSKKRCVFSFTCKTPLGRVPLIIDTSGTWCRPEGGPGPDGQLYLCGGSPGEEDPDSDSFEVEWNLFEELYWPNLAHRIPAFEAIKPGRAWAGHYDMCALDHNAIIGPAGDLRNFYLANGFSGHGLQQSPAVGRGIAELIVHGGYRSLDLSDLGFERVIANRPLLERNVI